MTMLSPTLTRLTFSNNPSLVEVPSSIQNLNQLEHLEFINCRNLETLPTGINLESLTALDLSHCCQLRTFPDISTNISDLNLSYTAIEEVPRWIEKFFLLYSLDMKGCNNLLRVSPNISKLKHLERVDFSDCGALAEASWSGSSTEMAEFLPADYFSMVKLNFINCFNLDLKALIQNHTFFMQLILSGEEVPSYFNHFTTGTSISLYWTSIPLYYASRSQKFFSFRGCTVIDVESFPTFSVSFDIEVCCRFVDRLGNHFDSADFPRHFITMKLGAHLVIFDCCFPLNEDLTILADRFNYHVTIQFHLRGKYSRHLKLKGCGIRVPGDSRSLEFQPSTPHIFPHVCEENASSIADFGGHETEQNQECGDSTLERKSSWTKILVITMGRQLKKLMSCYAANPQDT
ncbi:Disease resistance protein RPS6 [Cardamine amara subsp. amara]|uniref:Disease resistance protein RPS6 n=1 Tax=Cardamine amara subsp. amara TaxID=228776 RepID=A0ABD1BKM2_CARAN